MSTLKPRPHAELIKAWADGAKIQVLDVSGHWKDIAIPSWCHDSQYRIKPTTKKYRVALMDNGRDKFAMVVNSPNASADMESSTCFVRWLTDWVEYAPN